MKKQSSSILCAEHHTRHTVTFHEDGSIASSGCEDVEEKARRCASVARLRKKRIPETGCVALVALIRHGIPLLVNSSTEDLGAWKDIYIRFETNKLVVAAADAARRERDKEHGATFSAARQALRKAKYRPGWNKADLDEATSFLPNHELEEGLLVAVGEHDRFSVPLQQGWLENVQGAGIAVVSGKFVVGIDIENPRRVFAIARSPKTDFFVVRPFELETMPTLRLREVA